MKKVYIGTWRIKEMEMWDKDFIDLVAPGQIRIARNGIGLLRFGSVEAEIDCKADKIGDRERMEFTFEGSEEGDQCSGRGWAIVDGSEMSGRLYFHLGDDSAFRAVRTK